MIREEFRRNLCCGFLIIAARFPRKLVVTIHGPSRYRPQIILLVPKRCECDMIYTIRVSIRGKGEKVFMKETESSKIGGFPANSLVIPLAVIIAVLHIIIISLVFEVNRSNLELSALMQSCSDFQQSATNIQAGSSTLSETATSFVQMPVTRDSEVNIGPLMQYVQELGRDRSSSKIAEWFRSQNINPEIQSSIDAAAADAERMYETQLHAISLLFSVYPRPPIPELAAIPEVPLTEEEQAMTEEERVEYARNLILNKDYSSLKASVSNNIENSHRAVQEEYSIASAKCEEYISSLRIWLWIVIFTIIIILFCAFILFYRWLILPLRVYAGQITSDQCMHQASRIREMRMLVSAYNALLKRHDKLESILRSAAETDTLTHLPNRYSLEHYVLEIIEDGGTMAVLLFDVNYLKRTNDNYGHSAGDQLLRTAGACIRECFEAENLGRCYRIGGDEFAAVLRECSKEEVERRIQQFSLVLEREHISVSVGCAFAEKTDENSFEKLMKEADKRMYEQKNSLHEQDQRKE